MTIRRNTQEIEDEQGRRSTAIEEPATDSSRHADGALAEREVTSARPGSWNIARGLVRILALWLGVALVAVETLFGFRLAFLLAEANAGNGFVDFIYDVSHPLVEPFHGIFANETLNSGGVLEPATVIAMVVYFVAAALLIAAILVTTAGPLSGETLVTTRSRERGSTPKSLGKPGDQEVTDA